MLAAHFETRNLDSRRVEERKNYLEFLRTESMSLGLYALETGAEDAQQPHSEDEVYYVVEGRAKFAAGAERWPVQAGSILFVAAGVAHRFYEIEEKLQVLVMFAPPEGSAESGE